MKRIIARMQKRMSLKVVALVGAAVMLSATLSFMAVAITTDGSGSPTEVIGPRAQVTEASAGNTLIGPRALVTEASVSDLLNEGGIGTPKQETPGAYGDTFPVPGAQVPSPYASASAMEHMGPRAN